jgi:2-iminobutanoate/2-iminopropanoate deaminase
MIESLSSENLPAPRFRYSPLIKAGPFYKTAGMIALDKDTGELASGGVGAETAKILDNLVQALPDFGLSLDKLISATIYTTQFDQFSAINQAWEAVFTDDVRPPARTALGVSALPLQANVEIEFMFYGE